MSVALLLLVVTSFAQTPGYEFTTVVSHQATPVKDQGSTGTCWCFATASFMESELLLSLIHISLLSRLRNKLIPL